MSVLIEKSLPSLEQLPKTFAISLNNFSAIALSGADQTSYLQGQVTCDVNAMNENSLVNGAHCDAKGKVFSVFRLINRESQHLLLQSANSIESSLLALQKFGVFAKVEIKQTTDLAFAAIVGEEASQFIHQKFNRVPDNLTPVIHVESTTIVYLAGQLDRYLLIDSPENIAVHLTKLSLTVFNQNVWQLLEIQEGFPNLTSSSITEFVPQMLNVAAINGISFTKGCYLGQETVARMQYLGKNKRALFALQSAHTANVSHGDIIERKLGENWRKAGEVIEYYQADNGTTNIQAVLVNDLDVTETLRIKRDESALFSIIPLPYIH